MTEEYASKLSTASVLFCGLGFNLFVQYTKQRIGVTPAFFRLVVPLGVATIALMTLFAMLVDRHRLGVAWLLAPGAMTCSLALVVRYLKATGA